MIDLHAHILPGIDDGPPDMVAAIELAQAVQANGTTLLATTSHVDHTFGLDPRELASRRRDVQQALADAEVHVELVSGGELALSRCADLTDEELQAITLGDGQTIMLEPPFSPTGPLLEQMVFELQSKGFQVLIAHPERSPDFATRLESLLTLVDRGVLLQVTASSLSGSFGKHAQELAVELFRRNAVHVIASDAHGATVRTPELNRHLDAAAKVLPEVAEQRDYWTTVAPRAIVEGLTVPEPPRVRTRSRFSRFWRPPRHRGPGAPGPGAPRSGAGPQP